MSLLLHVTHGKEEGPLPKGLSQSRSICWQMCWRKVQSLRLERLVQQIECEVRRHILISFSHSHIKSDFKNEIFLVLKFWDNFRLTKICKSSPENTVTKADKFTWIRCCPPECCLSWISPGFPLRGLPLFQGLIWGLPALHRVVLWESFHLWHLLRVRVSFCDLQHCQPLGWLLCSVKHHPCSLVTAMSVCLDSSQWIWLLFTGLTLIC